MSVTYLTKNLKALLLASDSKQTTSYGSYVSWISFWNDSLSTLTHHCSSPRLTEGFRLLREISRRVGPNSRPFARRPRSPHPYEHDTDATGTCNKRKLLRDSVLWGITLSTFWKHKRWNITLTFLIHSKKNICHNLSKIFIYIFKLCGTIKTRTATRNT